MNEPIRFRLSSRKIRVALSCILLSSASCLVYGADYPKNAKQPLRSPVASDKLAASARTALFERNDAQRAEVLASREVARNPRGVEGWFLEMESAAQVEKRTAELSAAIAVCKLAGQGDPRAQVAGLRLLRFAQNSELFRKEREATEAIAKSSSACAGAALEALYEAALDGLPDADMRHLAQYSGWLTKYTVKPNNPASNRVPEQFEFADARIVVPDYLPRNATYVATTTFVAPSTTDYELSGDLTGAQVWMDEVPASSALALTPGVHQLRVVFSAAEAAPRLRITPTKDINDLRWAGLRISARETTYLRAASLLASGKFNDAAQTIRSSELARTAVGQKLVAEAARISAAGTASADSTVTCARASSTGTCPSDVLQYARHLVASNRHEDAVQEIQRVLHEWPLDRDAHRLLISELQRVGDNRAADRAAAQFLEIAPNARNFRRMAQTASKGAELESEPFYLPYRQPAPAAVSPAQQNAAALILLQDKVAIARADGSVSLYMHRVVQLLTPEGVADFRPLALPAGGRLLNARVINTERDLAAPLKIGDEVEEEYVVNFTGDGGMISHPEAFQCVFNDFDFPLLNARFVVLSPADESPGYVIASGKVPASRLDYRNGFRAEIWERTMTASDATLADPAIVRVVENENGWSVPPSVERRRILETIHPGPRPREA